LTSVITALGWSIVVVGMVALAAGYVLGWVEAVVVGWTALVMIAIATLYLAGPNAYDVTLGLPGNRVVVGDKAPGEVIVANPTRRRLPGVRVEVPVGNGLAEFAAPSLPRGDSHSDVFLVPTSRRGIIPIGPVRTV